MHNIITRVFYQRIILAPLILIISCKKDEPLKPPVNSVEPAATGVFVVNEGTFQWSNSSVTLFNKSSNEIEPDVFFKVNNRPLGDVAQSMTIFNGKGYVVVNNSGKIEVVDPHNFKTTGVIPNLTSPRYFVGVSASKAYVSDLYANAISVIDLTANAVVKQIPCAGWTEEMVPLNGKVYVTNLQTEYVYVINTVNDVVEDSIHVAYAPSSIVTDKNNNIWVLCIGNGQPNTAGLYKINGNSNQVETAFTLNMQAGVRGKLKINGGGDTLYYLDNGVQRLAIGSSVLSGIPFISYSGHSFYGLGIDSKSGVIYVSDALDFVQKGWVYRYNPSGAAKIDSFRAGIAPGEFCFF